MPNVCRLVRQATTVAIKTLSRLDSTSRFYWALRFWEGNMIRNRQHLLNTDSARQKALRELAKMSQQLRLCQKRLCRVRKLQPVPPALEEVLDAHLKQVAADIYQMGCFMLGVESKQ